MKYYPSISELISREALPADIGVLASATETAEQVLDALLTGIRFRNLIINQSAFCDVRFYSLTIVAKEVPFKLPGTEIAFLVFPGADGSGLADIPLAFDTVTRDVTDIDRKLEQLRILFGSWFGGLTWQDLEELLVPQFSLAVTKVPMALEFPRKWLVPLKADHTPNPDETVK